MILLRLRRRMPRTTARRRKAEAISAGANAARYALSPKVDCLSKRDGGRLRRRATKAKIYSILRRGRLPRCAPLRKMMQDERARLMPKRRDATEATRRRHADDARVPISADIYFEEYTLLIRLIQLAVRRRRQRRH